jgi:hypothetical protein
MITFQTTSIFEARSALSGVVFDGHFDSALEIVRAIKEGIGFDRCKRFEIQRYGNLAELHIEYQKSEQGQLLTRALALKTGDLLCISPVFEVVPHSTLHKFWTERKDTR